MVAFITMAYMVIYNYMEYMGDDLAYLCGFHGLRGVPTGYYDAIIDFFPRWVVKHWMVNNGRFANNLLSFNLLWFPHWFNALIVALATGAMFLLAIKCSMFRRASVTSQMVLIALMGLGLPWWDNFVIYAVTYNYVVAVAFALLMVWCLFVKPSVLSGLRGWKLAGWCCIGLLAGGMHEACGVPLVISGAAYIYLTHSWRELDKGTKWVAWSCVAGALWCLLSPGTWLRLGEISEPDDPLGLLLLKSDYIPLAYYIVLICLTLFKSGRRLLTKLWKTPWFLFSLASFGAFLFSAVSGIVGRSGWFASIFAMIGFFIMINNSDVRIGKKFGVVVSAALTVILIVHYVGFMQWQIRYGKETNEVIELYKKSDDGIVFSDVTRDDAQPWWLLNKSRGVIDADDMYLFWCFNRYYGLGEKRLVILPSEVRGITLEPHSEVRLGNGDFLASTCPTGCRIERMENMEDGVDVRIFTRNGVDWVAVPFMMNGQTLYHLSPRVLDPGDRVK